MKRISSAISFLALAFILTTSCNKEDDGNQPSSSGEAGFFYAENSAASFTKANEVTANKQYNTIIAKVNNATVVEIVLTDLKKGSYPLSTRYAFTYVKDGKYWEATAGTLTITKDDGNKISGTYEATAGSGVSGLNSVSGKFTEVPVK
jgi:hypothetical protein